MDKPLLLVLTVKGLKRLAAKGKMALNVLGLVVIAVWLLPASANENRDDGIEQLKHFVTRAVTAEGEFRQSVVLGAARRPQLSSGRFAFERPGRFRWEVEQPYPQLLVSDGGRLWIWDEDLNQLTIQELGDALGNTPAAILAGEGALDEAFELSGLGAEGGLAWVLAVPRQPDSSFESMRLGLAEGLLVQMELRDHFGQVTTIEFLSQRVGQVLAPDLFQFVPPPGADVIGSVGR